MQKTCEHKFEHQRGQVALIVLLIMTVGLTLGASLASRTVMDVSLSRQEQEGGRTFQAAESGIEDALSQDFSTLFPGGQTTYSNTLSLEGSDVSYSIEKKNTLETRVDEGGVAQIDVTGAVNGNSITILWGKGLGCSDSDKSKNAASLAIRMYNVNGGTTTARNLRYAACSYTDGFSTTGVSGDATNGYTVSLALQTNDTIVNIHPLYNDAAVTVQGGGWTLPTQYYSIQSTARNTVGNETKVIQLSRTIPANPSILDFVLYSGGTIVK
ncbi:MAG: hypothetical protein A2804_02710 [Candidatus Pacebacteria bacterium RIFCSPHIGHO2_01_FULL_46_10]|nr:MAG: hypothetical protein A2804_02710 [Candidatus Pacebacteria bacterium RIFCSPHIGHO2_01_FULL_46_10]